MDVQNASGQSLPERSWFQRIAEIGHLQEDSIELRRQKSLLTVMTLFKASFCAAWYLPMFLFGAYFAAAPPFIYQMLTSGSVYQFTRSKDLPSFRARQMVLILLLPLGVHWGLGGFAASGGVLLWSFLAPLFALLFTDTKTSIKWFVGFLLIMIAGGVLEITGMVTHFELPKWMILVFFVMNFSFIAGVTYAGVHFFGFLLEKEKEIQVQLNDELEQEKRQQEKLNEELKVANDHKSKFLAGMSHELRTPLNAIIGFTRIVRRKAQKTMPEKQIDNLTKVLVSAEHLLNLINDILDLAKIEAGQVDIDPETFLLQDLVKATLSTSETLVQDGVNLRAELPPNLAPIHSDKGKIRQILLNLISNAAKFTHEGEIVVRVKELPQGITLSVQDTGIGISEQGLARIFKEFQQAETSTAKKYGGTGLGLSICLKLAALFGGTLEVASKEGQGSTFTLFLPHPTDDTVEEKEEIEEVDSLNVTPSTGRTILTIDDDPDALYLLQENLKEIGYHAVAAQSGALGLEKARKLKPYAITLDIQMPEKNGWQILHELKQDPETKEIPVFILSVVDNKQLCGQLGAHRCLQKPLKTSVLKQALDQCGN